MLAIAAAAAIGSSIVGTIVSFHIDGATGPCIVLIQMAVFVFAFIYTRVGRRPLQADAAATRGAV
jgi:manganese/iron transport system permease protein